MASLLTRKTSGGRARRKFMVKSIRTQRKKMGPIGSKIKKLSEKGSYRRSLGAVPGKESNTIRGNVSAKIRQRAWVKTRKATQKGVFKGK